MNEENDDSPEPRKIVVIYRPRCPGCGSSEVTITHSDANGDSSQSQYRRCECCDHAFITILK